MATNNSVNMGIKENADGGEISLGVTARILKWLGAAITLTGSGTNVYTFPTGTSTLIGDEDADWVDLTDGGATTLHSHAGGGNSYLSAMRVYTADDTWSKPAGLHSIVVELISGGGGGGGVDGNASAGYWAASNGGGGGGYSKKRILAAALGATEAVTVGAGGAGGAAGDNDGVAGETSSFGAHLQATGGGLGRGHTAVNTTPPYPGGPAGATGGAGGVGSGGDINAKGSSGARGMAFAATILQGGAGGAAAAYSGHTLHLITSSEVAGYAGGVYGGGGTGACASAASNNLAGGDGANGVVIVYEYLNG